MFDHGTKRCICVSLCVSLYGRVIVGSNFNIGGKMSFTVLCECTSGNIKPDSWEITWCSVYMIGFMDMSTFLRIPSVPAAQVQARHFCSFLKGSGQLLLQNSYSSKQDFGDSINIQLGFISFITNILLHVIQQMHFSIRNTELRSESCELLVLKVW